MTRKMNFAYITYCLTSLADIETARQQGSLAEWDDLMRTDTTSSLFQGPLWCLEWYRIYHDRYRPFLAFVMFGESLVGLIPLAIEQATGSLVFACGNMSDYRDVVAIPEHKKVVVGELLRIFAVGKFPNPLRLGPMLPESNTADLVISMTGRANKTRAIARSHPGWRWWLTAGAPNDDFMKKKSVRQPFKYYQKQGAISLERIETDEEWDRFKQEFFDLHTLRQLYAGRPVSFNDPLKRELYDVLFKKHPGSVHVTSFRVAGRTIAAHYGPVRDRVLYWGAPAFDIQEAQRSPGLIMLAMIMQNAERLGLRGIDLTIGTEDYKKRFSTEGVDLPTVEVYSRPGRYHAQLIRDGIVGAAKSVVGRLKGPNEWDRIIDSLAAIRVKTERANKLGVDESLARLATRVARVVREHSRWMTYIAKIEDVHEVAPVLLAGELLSFHENQIGDFLKWDGSARETNQEISVRVRRAPQAIRQGRTLHTLLVNDRLAGWGWSYWPQEPEMIDVTQAVLNFDPKSISLYDFYTIPEFRGRRIYQSLLGHILQERFAQGAEQAYIMVQDTNVASRKAIERIGFRLVAIDEVKRLLRSTRLHHSAVDSQGDREN